MEIWEEREHVCVASFTDAWIETRQLERVQQAFMVASFTDAWIETKPDILIALSEVASFTDAWIETISEGVTDKPEMSHLLQMRGLKLARAQEFFRNAVASFTDAWIETTIDSPKAKELSSHLLQMRGLKLVESTLFINLTRRIFYRCVD